MMYGNPRPRVSQYPAIKSPQWGPSGRLFKQSPVLSVSAVVQCNYGKKGLGGFIPESSQAGLVDVIARHMHPTITQAPGSEYPDYPVPRHKHTNHYLTAMQPAFNTVKFSVTVILCRYKTSSQDNHRQEQLYLATLGSCSETRRS